MSVIKYSKVKFTLEQATKAQRYSSTLSLISAQDGVAGQQHAPAALPLEKRLVTHRIGGCVGYRVGLDGYGKPHPHRDSIPGPSSTVANHYTD
jgi:hypothetical protein